MRIIKWFAGFFEDQGKSASSKRLIAYIAMYYLWIIVRGSIEGKQVNETILFTITGIILFSIGAITTEFFKDNTIFKK